MKRQNRMQLKLYQEGVTTKPSTQTVCLYIWISQHQEFRVDGLFHSSFDLIDHFDNQNGDCGERFVLVNGLPDTALSSGIFPKLAGTISKRLFILLCQANLVAQLWRKMTNTFSLSRQSVFDVGSPLRCEAYESWDILAATFLETCFSKIRSFNHEAKAKSLCGRKSIICRSSKLGDCFLTKGWFSLERNLQRIRQQLEFLVFFPGVGVFASETWKLKGVQLPSEFAKRRANDREAGTIICFTYPIRTYYPFGVSIPLWHSLRISLSGSTRSECTDPIADEFDEDFAQVETGRKVSNQATKDEANAVKRPC